MPAVRLAVALLLAIGLLAFIQSQSAGQANPKAKPKPGAPLVHDPADLPKPGEPLSIRTPVLTRRIGIITKSGRSLQPAAQRLVEALHAAARR